VGDPTAYLSDDGVVAQGVARGRFNGALAGSRLGRRFSVGRWTAQSELSYDPATKTATGRGTMLLRFRDRSTGSTCLLVTVIRAREKNGALAESGTVTPLSGSGLGARLAGTARFTSRAGDHPRAPARPQSDHGDQPEIGEPVLPRSVRLLTCPAVAAGDPSLPCGAVRVSAKSGQFGSTVVQCTA
jgi:hypothetical protein